MTKHKLYLFSSLFFLVQLPDTGYGFEVKAHEALSRQAVNPGVANAAQLDNYLKSVLGFEFQSGITEQVSGGKRVVDLIADGSVQEDSPPTRVLHHFHDPTRTWDQAGERFAGIPVGNSSVVWSQMSPQGACCGNFAWKNARDGYFDALTSTTESQRKLKYAETFRILGHLIHHIQDAAVPSHSRNDNHLRPFRSTKFPDGDPFHEWADRQAGIDQINSVIQALRFDPSVLNQQSQYPLAPVPISRIIDKTDEDFGVLSPNLNIGLAEYSNANFISKGTARSTTYLYPRYSQLEFGTVETLPNGKRVRYAKFRPGFGEQDYRVGVSSRMALFANASVPPDSIDFGLDDNVHEDYGRKLFPRAIGYSAGLIDYFFRGFVQHGYYGVEVPAANGPPTTLTEQLWPPVFPEEQTGAGTVVAVLVYRAQDFTAETFPTYVISAPVTTNLTSGPQDVTFSFGSLPFPATLSGTVYYRAILVYRGPLGAENDAVIASPCDGADVAFMRFTTSEGERFYGGPLEGCSALPQ
jgi:hypothetical protein